MTHISKKYDLIFTREQQFAKMVAVKVIDKPEISAWMFLIPVIFIHYIHRYQKFQAGVKIFTKEFMFTKKVALDAAFEAIKDEAPKAEAIARCYSHQQTNSTDRVKEIRQKQMKEIESLFDHYIKLLKAEGDAYQSLLKNAYKAYTNYTKFLKQLQQAEKEVNLEALQLISQTEGFPKIVSKIEVTTEHMRLKEADIIFY